MPKRLIYTPLFFSLKYVLKKNPHHVVTLRNPLPVVPCRTTIAVQSGCKITAFLPDFLIEKKEIFKRICMKYIKGWICGGWWGKFFEGGLTEGLKEPIYLIYSSHNLASYPLDSGSNTFLKSFVLNCQHNEI